MPLVRASGSAVKIVNLGTSNGPTFTADVKESILNWQFKTADDFFVDLTSYSCGMDGANTNSRYSRSDNIVKEYNPQTGVITIAIPQIGVTSGYYWGRVQCTIYGLSY